METSERHHPAAVAAKDKQFQPPFRCRACRERRCEAVYVMYSKNLKRKMPVFVNGIDGYKKIRKE